MMNKLRTRQLERRIRVERYTKCITWVLVVLASLALSYFDTLMYVYTIVITTIWFFVPDMVAYLLETHYHVKHKLDNYR